MDGDCRIGFGILRGYRLLRRSTWIDLVCNDSAGFEINPVLSSRYMGCCYLGQKMVVSAAYLGPHHRDSLSFAHKNDASGTEFPEAVSHSHSMISGGGGNNPLLSLHRGQRQHLIHSAP